MNWTLSTPLLVARFVLSWPLLWEPPVAKTAIVDDHQRTTVKDLYAAGDVVIVHSSSMANAMAVTENGRRGGKPSSLMRRERCCAGTGELMLGSGRMSRGARLASDDPRTRLCAA